MLTVQTPSQHSLSVHYLRAVAALMVVLYHVFSYRLVTVDDALAILWLREGVAIFFVISGYVMVSSTESKDTHPASFLWRRIKRVAPLYWIATACIALNAGFQDWSRVIASFLFIPAIDARTGGIGTPILDVGWTLNFEMAFYLLFAIFMLLPRRLTIWGLVATLTLLAIGSPTLDGVPSFLAYYGQSFLLDFVAGILIAHMRIRLPAPFLVVGFLLLALVPHVAQERFLSATIPAALILASALSLDEKLPKTHIWSLLGDASYAIYLTHLFVIIGFLLTGGLEKSAYMGVAALITAAMVGIIVHIFMEIPLKGLIEWGERASSKLAVRWRRKLACLDAAPQN